MNRAELVKEYAERMDMKQTESKVAIETLESIILSVQDLKDENESVKFANATFSSKFVEDKSGEVNGKPYHTPAHHEGTVKRTGKMKDMYK